MRTNFLPHLSAHFHLLQTNHDSIRRYNHRFLNFRHPSVSPRLHYQWPFCIAPWRSQSSRSYRRSDTNAHECMCGHPVFCRICESTLWSYLCFSWNHKIWKSDPHTFCWEHQYSPLSTWNSPVCAKSVRAPVYSWHGNSLRCFQCRSTVLGIRRCAYHYQSCLSSSAYLRHSCEDPHFHFHFSQNNLVD